MMKPDLDNMWETYIKIGSPRSSPKRIQYIIRTKIGSVFPKLLKEEKITWYHFLLHGYRGDPTNIFFHVRYSPTESLSKDDIPNYCKYTEKLDPIRDIDGINKSLLKDGEIEKAWKLLGEQSEWIINLIESHKDARARAAWCLNE